jgi:DNA repair exonuclease SbcCD nuclease subunit
MRILFIGDVHIKKNNIQDVDKLIKVINDWTLDLPDIAVVAGDVLDKHETVAIQLMNKAYELIRALKDKLPTYILVGNHDYINNSQFLSENHWMTGLKELDNVFVADVPLTLDTKYGTLIFVPYVPPGRFEEALSRIPNWESARCIFAHQEIRGCKMGPITSTIGDIWEDEWPQVISGHIHQRHWPQKNVIYPGSALNHSFGYDCQGLSIFDMKDMSEQQVELHFDKKKILYITLDELYENENEFSHELLPHNKFSLEGTIPEITAFKKTDLYKNMRDVCKVVFRPVNDQKPISSTRSNRQSFPDILNKMVKTIKDKQLEDDYRTILMKSN